jgi:hypothetical protein
MKMYELFSTLTHQRIFPFFPSFIFLFASLPPYQTDPPLITLEFGTNPVVEGNIVSEGADVYFECNIKANPWVYRVAWRHNVSKIYLCGGGEVRVWNREDDIKI